MGEYLEDAKGNAKEMAENFLDEIVEQIIDGKTISDDANNDYPDGDAYHHENHVDRSYSLLEAATLLDELSSYEETDSGLWEGLMPREAISAQAAYTYGACVYELWTHLVKDLNAEDWTPLMKGKNAGKDKERVTKAVEAFIENW